MKMGVEASSRAYDRRAFLRRLGQGAATALLGLAGVAGLARNAAAQEPRVLCVSVSQAEFEKLRAEGKLPQGECQCCCHDDCC